MKQILLMSALALGLCACGPGSEYRGAATYAPPQSAGATEQNNDSCAASPTTGGDVCSMTHEQSNSGSDAHGGDRGK